MRFISVPEDNIELEAQGQGGEIRFGIEFLDDTLLGIFPDDLVLVGAPSGVGKTQFAVNVAIHALTQAKKVHYFALEAGRSEITRRLKWPFITEAFYSDPDRPRPGHPLSYDEWRAGHYKSFIGKYSAAADDRLNKHFGNFHVFYKTEAEFTSATFIEHVLFIAQETDLIIVDHAHYFDWDDSNDNRALKEIAKTVRMVNQVTRKPVLLVAHLRKRDRYQRELCAGIDEFHGSSDLTKIATKIITLAPGESAPDGKFFTYMRVPKNRENGSVTRYLGKLVYDPVRGGYEEGYKLGCANAEEFSDIAAHERPSFCGRAKRFAHWGNRAPSV